MNGTVKWFSQEKGFGFLVDEEGIERYFHVRSIVGVALPNPGATVRFTAQVADKGPRAINVQIVQQAVNQVDDRIACPHCGKRIVPRIIVDRGSLSHSVCPFCGGTVKNFNPFGWVLTAIIFIIVLLGFMH